MTEANSPPSHAPDIVPADSALPGLLALLPSAVQPYALLARLDRPVGIWLLFLPCLMGLMFQRIATGVYTIDLLWAALFLIGAAVMRGAGCTWNDITDRNIDAGVARTQGRPLPSGAVTLNQAYLFLVAQLIIGLLVWLCLPRDAKIVAVLSLPLIGAYPFMKRITWWPQAWLGMTLNWGILVGAATASTLTYPVFILYAGCICWTIAYDTIYALQDKDDDALMGVRSTARLFGDRAVLVSFCFYMAAAALIAWAAAVNGAGRVGALISLAFFGHSIWQITRLKNSRNADALLVFKSNVWAGAIIALGFTISALLPEPKQHTIFADHEIVPTAQEEKVILPFGLQLNVEPGETQTQSQPQYLSEWIDAIDTIPAASPDSPVLTAE